MVRICPQIPSAKQKCDMAYSQLIAGIDRTVSGDYKWTFVGLQRELLKVGYPKSVLNRVFLRVEFDCAQCAALSMLL